MKTHIKDGILRLTGLLCVVLAHPGCLCSDHSDMESVSNAKPRIVSSACDDIKTLICNEIGQKSGACALMEKASAKMASKRCEMMLAEPEQTLEDMRQMEESRLPLSTEKQALLLEGNPPMQGPATASVTVVMFADFHCEQCIFMAYVTKELTRMHPNVRVAIRQNPSTQSEFSHLAAQASLAAHDQNRFWEYYEKIYNNQHNINRETIVRCAREIGLKMTLFNEALESQRFKSAVDADMALAARVFAGPAPYFFVNGIRVSGVKSAAELAAAIETAEKKQ